MAFVKDGEEYDVGALCSEINGQTVYIAFIKKKDSFDYLFRKQSINADIAMQEAIKEWHKISGE